MGLKSDITKKVNEILSENFSATQIDYIPDITDTKLTFGSTGLRFKATVLYIDMRGSTKVLNKHNKSTIAKIHKAYLHTTVKVAKALGGEVRSFNGDSVLAFFPGSTKETLNNAVKAAMKITYMISNVESGINKMLKKYSAVNFGIGLDYGEILCTKIGVGGNNNTKDLIWIGNSINKSVIISDECEAKEFVGISEVVYNNLNDEIRYTTEENFWGEDVSVDIWKSYNVKYNAEYETYYKTSWFWEVN